MRGRRPKKGSWRESRQVVVIGSRSPTQHSMRRYTVLLAEAYTGLGFDVEVLAPPVAVSSRVGSRSVRKAVSYVESLVFFPFVIANRTRGTTSLVHIADHSDAFLLVSVAGRGPTVVTCHDLIAVEAAAGLVPEWRPRLTGRVYQRLVMWGLGRADALICVSHSTRKSVRALLQRDAEVVYNPIDPLHWRGATDGVSGAAGSVPTRRHAIVVATSNWRKRRIDAIRVWAGLRSTDRYADTRLIVVGDPLNEAEAEYVASLPRAVRESIWVSGESLTDAELANLYAGASLAIIMSSHEGFGWPLIEAQAHGAPVLCSPIPPFREVGGSDVVFLDPSDLGKMGSEEWGDLAGRLASLDSVKASLNVRRFSWENFTASLRHALTSLDSQVP
jgi:glycosyltransferase involved in cell wall biosynthesis